MIMANPSQIRRDHERINLDTLFSCRNQLFGFNEYGEPETVSNTVFKRWGKLFPGFGDIRHLLPEGARIFTGTQVLVRYDPLFDLKPEEINNFITIDGVENIITETIILDRKRWLILDVGGVA